MRRLLPFLLICTLGACGRDDGAAAFHGYVEGDYLRIAAPEGGWIMDQPLLEGAMVKAGATLFRLDDVAARAVLDGARADLAQAQATLADRRLGSRPAEIETWKAQQREAEAALRLARQELERQRTLAADNVAAKARLDEAQSTAAQAAARVERLKAQLATALLPSRADQVAAAEAAVAAARAAVDQAEWRLSQRHITSPADALVDDVVRRPGEWAAAGAVVVSLLPPGAVKLVLFVPEQRRSALAPGGGLDVTCDGCAAGLKARITRIASEAEYTPPVIYSEQTRAKQVYRIEAVLTPDAAALYPGQPVSATPTGGKP